MAKYLDDTGLRHLLTKLATKEEVTNADTKVGDLTGLGTTAKDSVVEAINELNTEIGDLSTLTTTHKTTIVGAINEVDAEVGGKADKATNLAGYGIQDAYTKTETDGAIKVVSDKLGDLGTLGTTHQTTIVGAINEIEGKVSALQAGTYDDSELRNKIGNLDTLTTTEKTNLVGAVNELDTEISTVKTESTVTVEEDALNPDFAKVYSIKQNGIEVGKVNIPKDMVVQSGRIVTDPVDQAPGKYLELTIANGTGDKIYIAVADLAAAYTAAQTAPQVQLAISLTNEISATIVAGSITATELATNAVTTDKILDANVTLAKLATDVTNAFDASGSATAAETNAKAYTDQKVAEIVAISTDEIDAMF